MAFPKPRKLSKKKVRKSITIPEYLDDWIKRYLKYEKDQMKAKGIKTKSKTKSYSSFMTEILEKVMNLFLKGKNMEDLEGAVDNEIKSFYEKITFQAVIEYYEFIVSVNKYRKLELEKLLNLFMMYQNFFTSGKDITEDDAIITLNRFKNFMISNNTTKDIIVERSGEKYIFQYFGIYPEMHYDFSKWIAGILGFLGIKINAISHSNNYTRIDFELTDIFKKKEAVFEDRKKLFNFNTEYFTNFNMILEDEEDLHLWLRINESKLPIISFKNVDEGLSLIREIIDDLNKWIPPRLFDLKVLELFKKLRWIELNDESRFSFKFLIEKNSIEYKIMKIIFNELKLSFEENEDLLIIE